MATMTRGFLSIFGTASSSAAAFRTSAEEGRLWAGGSITWSTFGDDSGNFGHQNERVATAGDLRKDFHAASAFAMLGLEGRQMGFGSGSRHAFTSGTTEVAAIRWVGNTISITLAGTTIASHSLGVSYSDTIYYTLEFAFGTSGGFVVCETRLQGARIPALTTSNFVSGGAHSAGTMSTTIAAAGTPMTSVIYNHGNQGSPLWYYLWQKNHSAVWTSLPTGGTAFADQSDFVGIKKKYILVPNALGAYTMPGAGSGSQASTWTVAPSGSAATHYNNIADVPIDNTLYVQNTTDAGGADSSANSLSHGYSNLPAAATRVGWVQRTVWAQVFNGTGILARSGIRSGAGDTLPNTDFFDTTTADAPTFGSGGYTPGTVQGAGTRNCSNYYPQQGTLSQFTTGGTSVWSVTTVNAIEGIFQTVNIV